jgi:hypothetical protein
MVMLMRHATYDLGSVAMFVDRVQFSEGLGGAMVKDDAVVSMDGWCALDEKEEAGDTILLVPIAKGADSSRGGGQEGEGT